MVASARLGGLETARALRSALLVAVPEAAALVDPWRALHDSSAAVGVPGHVTILYPFVPAERIDDAVEEALLDAFGHVEPFAFRLARLTTLGPSVLCLVPELPSPFELLTRLVRERWPELLPYEGTVETVVHHLTIAEGEPEILATIAPRLQGGLPVEAVCHEIWLMTEGDDGRWRLRTRFPLGRAWAG